MFCVTLLLLSFFAVFLCHRVPYDTSLIFARIIINSLTAIGAHERPLFNELRGSVVSRRVFIRLQSLIARGTRNVLILVAVACDLYEVCRIDDVSRGSKLYLFGLVNIHRFVRCVAR